MSDLRAVRIRIEGRVQGVGYRWWFAKEAEARNLAGWVRNRADRSVEALLQGPGDRIDELVALSFKGPLMARVHDVAVTEQQADPEISSFQRLPTV
ncbi:MAG: acylphosphatase [Rhodospirillales bacterium]